jgi:hypothetical protein
VHLEHKFCGHTIHLQFQTIISIWFSNFAAQNDIRSLIFQIFKSYEWEKFVLHLLSSNFEIKNINCFFKGLSSHLKGLIGRVFNYQLSQKYKSLDRILPLIKIFEPKLKVTEGSSNQKHANKTHIIIFFQNVSSS